jgi:hypothetical protein
MYQEWREGFNSLSWKKGLTLTKKFDRIYVQGRARAPRENNEYPPLILPEPDLTDKEKFDKI